MKKTRTVKVVPVKERKQIITEYYCDICKGKIGDQIYSRMNQCAFCGRHIHDNFKCGDDHPDQTMYDYPDHLCRICLDLYYKLMSPLLEQHERAEEEMLERIKKESKLA